MSNLKKKLSIEVSEQYILFDSEIVEGALDVSLAFRDALSKGISKCKESRWQIAAKISELTGRNISKDMLDKYTSSNLDYALRAEDLPAVLYVINSFDPARALIQPVGGDVIDEKDSKLIKLARLEQEKSKLETEMVKLKNELGIRK